MNKRSIKLISWNVNGIRSVIKKGFKDFIAEENPDVLCLQETKVDPSEFELTIPDYNIYWNSPKRKGYSGTALFSKVKPLQSSLGLNIDQHDNEGRMITAEFSDFYLVNVYTPNSKRDLSRLGYRQEWDRDFLAYLKRLERKKPVVFCGDLNVAHREIDLTNPKSNEKNHGFTPQERAGFDKIVEAGFIDTFRELHDEGGHYTWWSQMNHCRKRNIGWRIDYFCISSSLRPQLNDAYILPQVMGSDHCPVVLLLNAQLTGSEEKAKLPSQSGATSR